MAQVDKTKEDRAYVMSLWMDRGFWIRSAYFLEKYKLVWMIALGTLVAFGWQYVTPNDRLNTLQAQQRAFKTSQDSMAEDVTDIKKTLRILTVVQCLDRTSRELAYMGLDCTRVEQYMRLQKEAVQ